MTNEYFEELQEMFEFDNYCFYQLSFIFNIEGLIQVVIGIICFCSIVTEKEDLIKESNENNKKTLV
jgi:hypothetical protein